MRKYGTDTPVFNEMLDITETTDTSHADNINKAPIEVFQNTLVLGQALDSELVEKAFNEVFTKMGGSANV